jgi:hypothetical protein
MSQGGYLDLRFVGYYGRALLHLRIGLLTLSLHFYFYSSIPFFTTLRPREYLIGHGICIAIDVDRVSTVIFHVVHIAMAWHSKRTGKIWCLDHGSEENGWVR